MALTGAVVRLGNANDFGIQESSPRGCSAFDENLYVLGASRLILMSNLAAGEGEYVSQTLIQNSSLGALGEHDGRLYLTDGSDLHVFGDPFRGIFGTADTSVTIVGDLNGVGDTLLPKGLASDGTNLHFVYDGNGDRNGSDIYSIDVTDASKTFVGKIVWPSGVTAPKPLGLFHYDGAFHVVERSQGNLYRLSDPDPTNSNAMTATRVGTATQFGVSEYAPTGSGVFNNRPYLVGSGNDAIYRFIDTDDTDPPAETDAVLQITVNPASVETSGVATVTFTFDKTVTGFSAADITISAGAKGALSGSGASYTMPITAPSSGSGTVTVSVAADAVSPGNNADSISFTYAAPAVVLSFDGMVANQMIGVGDTFSLTLPEGTGGSGTYTYSLTGTLPTGLTFDPAGPTITGSVAGSFASMQFTYNVNDGTDTVSLMFNIAVVADPIVFAPTNIADQIWRVGTSVNVGLPAASGGVGAITLTLTPALPASVTFSASTRLLKGIPANPAASTEYTYTATDTEGTAVSLTFHITVEAMMTMTGPVDFGTDTIADQNWVVGTAVDIQLPRPTGGMGTLMYGFSPALPDGLNFNQTTQRLTGTPTAAQSERTYRYFASEDIDLVIDGDGNLASDFDSDEITDDTSTDYIEFQLTITGVLAFVGAVNHQLWVTGTTIDVELPRAVGGLAAITYTLAPTGLPAGTSLTDRVISGMPNMPTARVLYAWSATDGTNTVVMTFNITVGNPIVFIPPDIANPMYQIGEPVNTLLPLATDGTMGTITLSLSPAPPTGLTFDPTTRRITGTPREIISGKQYRYQARNAVTQAHLDFRIFVRSTAYTASNIEFQTMLPPNATEWELSVEEALRENILPVDTNLHIQMPIIDAWNPDLIPTHLITYLGLNLSIEVDSALPETEQRNLLRGSYGIHSIEGTPQSLLNIIFALGFDGAVIREGVEDPADSTTHWAHYSIEINQSITVAQAQRMVDLVKDVAPARCKLVSVDIAAGTETYDGSNTYDGTHTYGQISEVSGLVL